MPVDMKDRIVQSPDIVLVGIGPELLVIFINSLRDDIEMQSLCRFRFLGT